MVPNRLNDLYGKHTRFDDSPNSTHNLVVGLVEPGSRVLEFGCATGYMSQVLRDRLGATVLGVELQAEAAQEASSYCERVLIGDAEDLDLEAELGGERFDAILFADVLEHLREPANLLRRVRPLVTEGGAVVASIPNVAHASVRLALLAGSFRYREEGLLDESHLRFFTREGIQDMFEGAGYAITEWLRRRLEPEQTEIPIPAVLPEEARAWATSGPEATTYQFVVRAVPSEPAAQLIDLRTQLLASRSLLDDANAELEKLRPLAEEATVDEIRSMRASAQELEALRRAHDVLRRRTVAEQVAFGEAIAAVQEEVYGSRSWRYTAPMRKAVRLLRRLTT